MQRFSAFSLFRHGLGHHQGWKPQWRQASPKPAYDAIVVGGGGHGLGAAYSLAKVHGMRNVAVLAKGWTGCGNPGPNTTITRSHYLFAQCAALHHHSLTPWDGCA